MLLLLLPLWLVDEMDHCCDSANDGIPLGLNDGSVWLALNEGTSLGDVMVETSGTSLGPLLVA
jgi:hypothetical protein